MTAMNKTPWRRFVERLLTQTPLFETSNIQAVRSIKYPPPFLHHEEHSGGPQIHTIRRASSTTVTLDWCDATTGHYADQRWRIGRSRRSGYCALTGARIEVGDTVYKPLNHRPKPGNVMAMISASCIRDIPGEDPQ